MTQCVLPSHRICAFSILQPSLRDELEQCVCTHGIQRRIRPLSCLMSQASLLITTLSHRFAKYAAHVEPFDANPKLYLRRSKRLDDMPNGFMWPGSILRAQWSMCQNLAD